MRNLFILGYVAGFGSRMKCFHDQRIEGFKVSWNDCDFYDCVVCDDWERLFIF